MSYYYKMKEKGLCPRCGKKNDTLKAYCSTCRNKMNSINRENKEWYKNNNICPSCGKRSLFGDEKICLECAAKSYSRSLNRDKSRYNENHKKWSKIAYQKAKEQGICTRCLHRKADKGYFTCGICRYKTQSTRKKSMKQIVQKDRANHGLCYFCGEPVKRNYKVCEKHYQMCLRNGTTENANRARKVLQEEKILY